MLVPVSSFLSARFSRWHRRPPNLAVVPDVSSVTAQPRLFGSPAPPPVDNVPAQRAPPLFDQDPPGFAAAAIVGVGKLGIPTVNVPASIQATPVGSGGGVDVSGRYRVGGIYDVASDPLPMVVMIAGAVHRTRWVGPRTWTVD